MKFFSGKVFAAKGLKADFPELACSVSKKGVLRGLHFQLPPADHAKVVFCARGKVLDAVVDIRVGSPTYGKHLVIELDSENGNGVYVPRGMAHGFYVLSEEAVFVYKIETPWAPSLDAGIAWDSAGIAWPNKTPILSEKDKKLPKLADYKSPFRFK